MEWRRTTTHFEKQVQQSERPRAAFEFVRTWGIHTYGAIAQVAAPSTQLGHHEVIVSTAARAKRLRLCWQFVHRAVQPLRLAVPRYRQGLCSRLLGGTSLASSGPKTDFAAQLVPRLVPAC